MNTKIKFNIIDLINASGCFDLQFRKDTRHERTNSPTYYRWKIQFVVAVQKEDSKKLEHIKKAFACGKISQGAGQARFSVQDIDDIADCVIPYFHKNRLADNKKKDFELWKKAVEIIHKNKGKYILKWKKSDLLSVIEIHKSSLKYKENPRPSKWIQMAQDLAKTI